MYKGLDELEKVLENYKLASKFNGDFLPDWRQDELLEPIKKELKALEIIKQKKPSIQVVWHCEDYNVYTDYLAIVPIPKGSQLTQEEFDLLREMLK